MAAIRDRVLIHLTDADGRALMTINTKWWDWRSRATFVIAMAGAATGLRLTPSAEALSQGYPPDLSRTETARGVWEGQSRKAATALVVAAALLMMIGIVAEPAGLGRFPSLWLFMAGSLVMGVALPRHPKVLMTYFGDRGGRARFVLEVAAIGVAYLFDAAGEGSPNMSLRLASRLASLIPWLAVLLVIWLPLSAKDRGPPQAN
jgi:hypothetical protein